jgi:hypothetical protein
VRPTGRVLLGKTGPQRLGAWVDEGGALDVEAELAGPPSDGVGVTQQREPHHASAQELVCGSQDPVLLALRQDDVLVRGPRPVEQLVLEHERRDDVAGGDLEAVEQLCAVNVLVEQAEGGLDLARRRAGEPRHDAREGCGGLHRARGTADDRNVHLEALDERRDRCRQVEAAVEDDARWGRQGLGPVGEQQAEQHVTTVRRGDDDAALEEAVEDVGQGHGSDDEAEGLAVEQVVVAVEVGAVDGSHEVAHRRRLQHRSARDDVCRCVPECLRQRRPCGRDGLGHGPVRHDGEHACVVGPRLVRGDLRRDAHLLGRAPLARDDEDHRRIEVGGDACVVGELGRGGHVRVVRADDEHRVVPFGHGVEAVDDGGHRALGVEVDVLVADGGRLRRREPSVETREQQVEHVVTLRALGALGAHDRAEDADSLDPSAQLVEDSEGDGGFARQALRGCEIDTGCHDGRLSAG